jgi:hypothetical protein
MTKNTRAQYNILYLHSQLSEGDCTFCPAKHQQSNEVPADRK